MTQIRTIYVDAKEMVCIIIIMIIIIIITTTLFQEDNIFGTNASLTYGPQIQRHTCV